VIGAIIAGGASARFDGRPKGLQRVGGRRIIDRVADALSGVATELVLIANATDSAAWLPGVRTVRDSRSERGSLVGLHTALTQGDACVLAVAWDMPFVTRELLELIAQRGAEAEYAVVPQGPKGPEPFCALYTAACVPFSEAALDADDLRLSALLARLPGVEYVGAGDVRAAGDPAQLFFNVNDAADLATAERMAHGG
jgi:molybdopterin-guanine dinucleotide biosynthesis protein A